MSIAKSLSWIENSHIFKNFVKIVIHELFFNYNYNFGKIEIV